MTTTTLTMIDRVEDALAQLCFQMDHIGNSRFQEEIERVSDAFPVPEGSPSARRIIQRAHDLFQRVQSAYTPMAQRRTGHSLLRCPHCTALGKEAPSPQFHAA